MNLIDTPSGFVRFRKIPFLITIIASLLSSLTVLAAEFKKPDDILLVRGDYKYPPYEFVDENGLPAGYNVDIFNAVAEVMGLETDLQLGPWSEVRKALEDGKIDVLIGMFYSEERDRLVDFSIPHLVIHHAVFVRKGASIQSEGDLFGKEIIVQDGDIMHDYARAMNYSKNLILVDSQSEGLRLLASGRHDCLLGVKLQGLATVHQFKLTNITTVGPPIYPRNYGFAVTQGNTELLAKLNEGLNIIKQTGEFDRIYEKWFDVVDPGHPLAPKVIKYTAWTLIPVLIVLMLSALWLLSLKKQVARKTRDLEHELSERKRSGEALRASEDRFRTALDANPDPVVIYDTEINVVFLNKAFTRVFGWTLEEKVGGRLDGYIPEENWPETEAMIARMQAGEGIYHTETYRFNKQGERIPVVVSGSVFTDRNGKPAGTIINLRDVREQRNLQAQLHQSQKMEAIGTLAGGIAHDFNNILSAVIGYTELALHDAEKGSLLYENLQAVFNAGIRARDLVQQILTFSRQTDQERKPVQVKLICKEALKFLRASLPTTIEIRHDIRSDAFAMADPTQIHQVLMNLCTNAEHAMRDKGGVLDVKLEDVELDEAFTVVHPELYPGSYIKLTVGDSGCGIPANVLNKIFDPFFTTKSLGEGTGMGLSVVHGIVGSNRGKIFASSKLGQGSIFTIYLPMYGLHPEPLVMAEGPVPTGSERILFVDDEPALVDIGKQIFESLGYDVTARTGSKEALELFRAKPDQFDLVITDMTMPNMAGDDLAKELIRINPSIPIILCTGYSARINRKQAMSSGIRAFVSKPVLKRDIADTIRKVLDEK